MDDIHNQNSHLLDSLDLVGLNTGLFSEVIHGKGAPLQQYLLGFHRGNSTTNSKTYP